MTTIGTNLEVREIVPLVKFLVTGLNLCRRYSRLMLVFGENVRRLVRDSGKPMACAYLKQATMDVYHHLAATPRERWSGQGPIVRVDGSGLPMLIPHGLRREISRRNVMVIKVTLSILTLYRALHLPARMKLSTITDSGPKVPISYQEVESVLRDVFPRMRIGWGKWSPLNLVTAGPNGPVSVSNASVDAAGFLIRPRLLRAFARLAGFGPTLWLIGIGAVAWLFKSWQLLHVVYLWGVRKLGWLSYPLSVDDMVKPGKRWFPWLGRLAIKHEPAGKARVFAITDWWSQSLLRPLHKSIFESLRHIREDGTHDQLAPVRRLLDLTRGSQPVYSFDLSAATDRFPVDLQVLVLQYFVGSTSANNWKQLLVERDWLLPIDPMSDDIPNTLPGWLGISLPSVRYGVGQPMGAYSSWAVFALTHHVVVQLAARRSGWVGWYPYYALLGDDIVIAGEDVANAYHALIRQLGVEISETKSLRSPAGVGVVEFAKHCLSPWNDYSAVGSKVLLAAFRTGLYLPALAVDLRDKSFPILPQDLLAGLQSTISFRRDSRAVAGHYRGVLSIFGPSGAYPLPLADWMSLTISPIGMRDWLAPGLALSLLYATSAIGQRERDAIVRQIRSQISEFWPGWPGLDKGLPSLFSILSPRFWLKAFELLDLEDFISDHHPHSTRVLRERVRSGERLAPQDVLDFLYGPDMDRPSPLREAAMPSSEEDWATQSRRMARLMVDLRRKTFRFHATMVNPVGNSDTALVVRTIPEPVEELMLAERFEDIPGCPWFISYSPAAAKYLNPHYKWRDIGFQPDRDYVRT